MNLKCVANFSSLLLCSLVFGALEAQVQCRHKGELLIL